MNQKDAERCLFTNLQLLRNSLCIIIDALQVQPGRGPIFHAFMEHLRTSVQKTDAMINFLKKEHQSEPLPVGRKLKMSDYIEFSNLEELKKFEKLPPITEPEVHQCDTKQLMEQLLREQ